MSDFTVGFEWEEPAGVRGAELAATWARLEVRANGTNLTQIEDLRTKDVRDGVYVPLYPLAEWLVFNWWRLWYEDRALEEPSSSLNCHSMLAAREGFALPDVRIWPCESQIRLESFPYEHQHSEVRFLNRAQYQLNKNEIQLELERLIDAVLSRLDDKAIVDTILQREWGRIAASQSDDSERRFCEYAARLGVDPYELDADLGAAVEKLLVDLPPSVWQDFFDSADPAKLTSEADALLSFFESANKSKSEESPWANVPRLSAASAYETPWQQGYEYARLLRESFQLNGDSFSSEADILNRMDIKEDEVRIIDWQADQIDAATGISSRNGPVFGLTRQHPRSRMFAFCRALGEFLRSETPQPLILTRRWTSFRQKRSRAFAAEFLAPAHQIRERLARSTVTDVDCEELGDVFSVSPWVIQHQIVNHRLAEYISEPYWT